MGSRQNRTHTSTAIHQENANETTNNDNITKTKKVAVVDDPCWGGPDHHDLSDLLSILEQKSRCILHDSDSYLVLDTPPDLRMDGPYPATVHKLLTYWYPPSSLLSNKNNNNLLEAVASLSKHSNVPDNCLRPVHQLDYATSGVLLVARTQKAAAAACRSFEHRKANKVYLAVVHGHMNMMQDNNKTMPILSPEHLSVIQTEEHLYRTTKARRRPDTFVGFLPVPAMFVKWQSCIRRQQQQQQQQQQKEPHSTAVATEANKAAAFADKKSHKKRRRQEWKVRNNTVLESHELETLFAESLSLRQLTKEDQEKLLTLNWSKARLNTQWKHVFEELADCYNVLLKKKAESSTAKESSTESSSLPTLFRIHGQQEEEAFYIYAALAEVKDDFRMRVHPNSLPAATTELQLPADESHSSDSSLLDYKPSLTRCVVLARGYLNGEPVTKVRLEPRTGRRHQLRLHMVVTGHPIVGDVTYEFPDNPSNVCYRMCLHAHSLSLPLLGGNTSAFVAPDPFVVVPDEHEKNMNRFLIQGPGGSKS